MCYLQVEQEARDEGCFNPSPIRGSSLAIISCLKMILDDVHFCEDRDIAVAQALERDMDLGG